MYRAKKKSINMKHSNVTEIRLMTTAGWACTIIINNRTGITFFRTTAKKIQELKVIVVSLCICICNYVDDHGHA